MENKIIYLDNAATTKPCDVAKNAMITATEQYGNPSSLHGLGFEAEKLVTKSKQIIAERLSVEPQNIYFTSGGTEANNLAIFGTVNALKKRGNRIITSKIEHPSVLECFKRLERDGFDVIYLDVDSDGRVIVDTSVFTENTIFVSVMHVNNETGVVEPIEELSRVVRDKCPNCIIHCDCVQSFGKIPVRVPSMGVDMVSISSHKIHGFKGTGVLYSNTNKIIPILYGGEQQSQIRPGTENTGGIFAFGAAAENMVCDTEAMKKKRQLMCTKLEELVDKFKINGSSQYTSGSVLNVSFLGIKAEILLHSLERHNIYVSTGSACSSHKPQPSHVLKAMGLSQKEIEGAIRISFSQNTTDEEIIFAAEKIAEEVKTIRRYVR